MALEDVELGPEDGAAAQDLGQAVLVARVDEVDLEERRVPDVVAVEVDALAQDDEGDVLRRLLLAVLVRERQVHGVVEGGTKAADVVVDCGREVERGGGVRMGSAASETDAEREREGGDAPESGSSLPLYST